MIDQIYYMTFVAGTSTCAGISATYHSCHMMPMLIKLLNQKSHVASQFGFLDLRNAVVPLMTPLALCDASISTNGVTYPEKSCCTSFQSS